MPRLFMGIPIPEEVKAQIASFRSKQADDPAIRWTRPEKLHFTAYFFAEVAEEMLENLKALLSLALKNQMCFALDFERYMLAPSAKEARMIWARYHKAEEFLQIHQSIHELYQQIQPNLQRRRSPIPHITLSRLKEGASKQEKDYLWQPVLSRIEVRELILWETIQSPAGSIYQIRETYSLLRDT